MRPVILQDALRLAAVLCEAKGQRARHRRLVAVFRSAERADAERRLDGLSAHGDGTVAGACAAFGPGGRQSLSDPEFCTCLAMVCRFLARRLGGNEAPGS